MDATNGIDIKWGVLNETRRNFGGKFLRHFGRFTKDGPRSVQATEDATRAMHAAMKVLAAYRLAEDAFLFGAHALGELAEQIETNAQSFVAPLRFGSAA